MNTGPFVRTPFNARPIKRDLCRTLRFIVRLTFFKSNFAQANLSLSSAQNEYSISLKRRFIWLFRKALDQWAQSDALIQRVDILIVKLVHKWSPGKPLMQAAQLSN